MSETNTSASSAVETPDVFNGETPTLEEFSQYRQTGEVPARFKTDQADSGTAQDSTEGEKSETEPDSATGRQQEKKNETASERIAKLNEKIEALWADDDPDTIKIAQLTATIDKIERASGLKRKTEVAPVAETKKEQVQQQSTRTEPTPEDTKPDGTPKYDTYGEYVKDLARWEAEQMLAEREQQTQQQAQAQKLMDAIEEGKEIYGEDFGGIANTTAGVIAEDARIPMIVKQRIGRSEILPHLAYLLGSDQAGLDKFVAKAKSDPLAALDYIAVTENMIREELEASKGEETGRNEKGQFTPTPAKQKTTAPPPPKPVSGASSGAFDVSDESLSADEWMRKRNAQLKR